MVVGHCTCRFEVRSTGTDFRPASGATEGKISLVKA
jgi:hypothetical protein